MLEEEGILYEEINLLNSNFSSNCETSQLLSTNIFMGHLAFLRDPLTYYFNLEDLEPREILSANNHVVKKYYDKQAKRFLAAKHFIIPKGRHHDSNTKMRTEKITNEIKVWQKLRFSKNIVNFYGLGFYNGDLLLCMELMDISLKDFYLHIHKKYSHFPLNLLGKICTSILNGLLDMKSEGILHGDIKPTNVLIKRFDLDKCFDLDGSIKLCDFGDSNILDGTSNESSNGTIAYWAPERFDIKEDLGDERQDIWSLGITIIEVVLSRIPYEKIDDPIALKCEILSLDPNKLANLCFGIDDKKSESKEKEFLLLCLQKIPYRPTLEELKKTKLYQKFS